MGLRGLVDAEAALAELARTWCKARAAGRASAGQLIRPRERLSSMGFPTGDPALKDHSVDGRGGADDFVCDDPFTEAGF